MVVSTSDMAEILGVSTRWIQQLTKDGILIQESRGKFHLPENIQRYIRYVENMHEDGGQKIDYNKEKALHERAKRKIAEMDLAEKEQLLIQVSEVEKVLEKMVGLFKARCLTIPAKVSPLVQYETELPVIVGLLKKEINEALQELSDHYAGFSQRQTGEENEPETS
ncbi:hypothetical protein KDJ56_07155 [Brevibacillus composti]|uniref:DNA-packaging protein n=1 Tax=Brevibacillus composti TaxID=2796470 RepID=A0A7T5EN66_9BACL|nr:hypothetical protein [Brevibacillus composti]QQE75708.1 hypothetical protein JD108_07475 [Brevibacillus composti]QUO42734.1 hypothetical protein KDJ56_07155 [Brevibacillus composti]